MAVRVSGFASGFVFSVVLARSVGADGAGAYYLAFSILTVSALIGRFGMDNPVVRMVAAAEADGSPKKAAAVFNAACRVSLAISAGTAGLLLISASAVAEVIFDDSTIATPLRVMAVGLPAWALNSIVGRALVGSGRVALGVIIEGGALSLAHLLLYGAVGRHHGVGGAAATFGVSNVVVLVAGVAAWRRYKGDSVDSGELPVDRTKVRIELLASSRPLFMVSVLNVAGGFVSLTLLGVLGSSSDVGIYAVSDRVAKTGAVALLSLNTVLAPRFARLHHRGKIDELRRLLRQSVLVLSATACVVTIPMVLFPGRILVLFGEDFTDVTIGLRLLAIAYGINLATGPVGLVLQMSKNEKPLRDLNALTIAIQVVIAIVLIPRFGIAGAATAYVAAIAVNNALCWMVIRQRLSPGDPICGRSET